MLSFRPNSSIAYPSKVPLLSSPQRLPPPFQSYHFLLRRQRTGTPTPRGTASRRGAGRRGWCQKPRLLSPPKPSSGMGCCPHSMGRRSLLHRAGLPSAPNPSEGRSSHTGKPTLAKKLSTSALSASLEVLASHEAHSCTPSSQAGAWHVVVHTG